MIYWNEFKRRKKQWFVGFINYYIITIWIVSEKQLRPNKICKKLYILIIACSMRWMTKGNKALWERCFRMMKHIFHKVFVFPVYAFSFKQSGLSKYHITLYINILWPYEEHSKDYCMRHRINITWMTRRYGLEALHLRGRLF